MKNLYRTDIVNWRVQKAREMGAKVGKNCKFYSLNFFSEPYLIEIGDNVIISGKVIFITHDGGVYLFQDEKPDIFGNFGKIKIGNNCFIGMGSIILQNVEIGDNCIIGAGSVVIESIPKNTVVIGNPAKVVFKTDIYKKMKLNSIYTFSNKDYPFPTKIPERTKIHFLNEKFANLPIRKAKLRSQNIKR